MAFLRRFAEATEHSIDLLYLDSLDLCWENTHPSALHHLMELCAAMPALSRSSLIVVDDHGSSEAPGKSAYVAQWMRHVGGRELFADYQIGWTLSDSQVSAPGQQGMTVVTHPPTPQTQMAATAQPVYSRPASPQSAPLHETPPRVAMIADSNSQEDDLLAEYFRQPAQYPGGFQGRGVVIAGGGGRFAVCTWVCVNRLRQLGCQLPIQVWYLGPEERDEHLFSLMAPLGVEAVDAYAVRDQHPHPRLRGWELKPYAIMHSRFEEVLLLDADNVPVVDPTFLFDIAEYEATGALFWPDYWRMQPDRSFWQVMGIEYVDEPEFESGQMVVNKARCWQALGLANWLCERGATYFWKHCHGDKDCFRAGWRRTQTPFSMPTQGVTTLSELVMVQYGFDGKRLFQHRNLAKWELGSNPPINDFWHEEACLDLIHIYRKQFLAAKHGLSELDFERSKKHGGRRYWYIRCRTDCRLTSFHEDLTIGEGAGALEQMYYEKNGALVLLDGGGAVTCELHAVGDLWAGRWRRFEQMPIVLEPA